VDPSGPVGGAKGGNFDIIPGHKGKNLCDITMGLTMPVWNGCIANNDGFAGWFGGQSCISIVSTNSGHAGVFSFDDSVSLNSGMKFFGVDINLLTASAEAKFESAGGPSTVGPTVSGPVALAGVDECCPPIEGPSTIIPIMGYPLVITSQLNVHVNGKDLKPVANPMPSDCNAGPIKVVAVTGKGSAQVSAQLVAALSIEIIEVGIKGVLDLVNDEIHGSIDTVANQGANALTVTPAMGYSSTRGSGEVTLFFTIDFFFSKTWTISLASWTGFQVKDEFPHDPGNGFAVTDPEVVCKTGK
jgi:hypothetical protein